MKRLNSRAAGRFNKTDAVHSLASMAARITGPAQFFSGICRRGAVLPDNVLLFTRKTLMPSAPPASHHRFVLILNLMTRGSVVIDHTPFILDPGHAILIFPYQFHCYANFQKPDILWLFVTFETSQADDLRTIRNLPIPLSDKALAHGRDLVDGYLAKPSDDRLAGNSLTLTCAQLLGELQRTEYNLTPPQSPAGDKPGPASDIPLPQRIGRLLEDNLTRPLRIDDIARRLGVSESHLRNTFREDFGVSLGRYLRELRIHKAMRLIGTTDLTLSEISDRCGYDSLFSFSRTFKRKMKMPPRDYRQRIAGR